VFPVCRAADVARDYRWAERRNRCRADRDRRSADGRCYCDRYADEAAVGYACRCNLNAGRSAGYCNVRAADRDACTADCDLDARATNRNRDALTANCYCNRICDACVADRDGDGRRSCVGGIVAAAVGRSGRYAV
jgi:hypothetical protein